MPENALIHDRDGERLKAAAESREPLRAVQAHPELAPLLSQVGETQRRLAGASAAVRDAEVNRVRTTYLADLLAGREVPEAGGVAPVNTIRPAAAPGAAGRWAARGRAGAGPVPATDVETGAPAGYYRLERPDGTVEYRDRDTHRKGVVDRGGELQVTGRSARDVAAALDIARERGWHVSWPRSWACRSRSVICRRG